VGVNELRHGGNEEESQDEQHHCLVVGLELFFIALADGKHEQRVVGSAGKHTVRDRLFSGFALDPRKFRKTARLYHCGTEATATRTRGTARGAARGACAPTYSPSLSPCPCSGTCSLGWRWRRHR